MCSTQLQKLVVLLREIHGYEEPELPEDEQQQEQLQDENEEDSSGAEDDSGFSGESDSNQTEEEQNGDDGDGTSPLEPADEEDEGEREAQPLHSDFLISRPPENSQVSMGSAKDSAKEAHEPRVFPHAMLSVTVSEPMKRSIQEPKPPRGGNSSAGVDGKNVTTSSSTGAARGSRLKFQFPDVELSNYEEDGYGLDDIDEEKADRHRFTSPTNALSSSASPSRHAYLQRRRFSSSAAISTSVPLRRKSFTMKRSPAKRIVVTTDNEPSAAMMADAKSSRPPPTSGPSRWATRRKSTSACFPSARAAKSPAKWKHDRSNGSSSQTWTAGAKRDAALSLASPRLSGQMVVRVRERKLDGIPELVIRKKPAARFIVWQWNERQVRIPFMIQLGPQQHGIMLRQLRYVKSVMADFPWAKAHLKDLLSSYTKKDMTKEQLYPQLTHLSHHVQEEIGSKIQKQRLLTAKKHHLTMQLTIAAGVVNDMKMVKFGRRGKPHDTKLCYDPSDPTRLHWLRKNGERSDEFLPVDDIDVRSTNAQFDTSVIKRAARKYPLDPECCVSLITGVRNLDLQFKSSLQRDWLLNALHDIISFAKQYKAAGVMGRRQQSHKDLRTLAVLGRR